MSIQEQGEGLMFFKERHAEIKAQDAENNEPDKMVDASTIKVEINNLLHMFMPLTSTIREVDQLALAILDTIHEAWAKEPT